MTYNFKQQRGFKAIDIYLYEEQTKTVCKQGLAADKKCTWKKTEVAREIQTNKELVFVPSAGPVKCEAPYKTIFFGWVL